MKKLVLLSLMSLFAVSAFAQEGTARPDKGAFKVAVKECRVQAGAQKGTKPSKEVREKVKACLESKGFKKSAKGKRAHRDHKKVEATAPAAQ